MQATRTAQETITVEVAYALPERQMIIPVTVPSGTTAASAIQASGILQQFPDIDIDRNKIGIFGKLAGLDTPLRDKDRVEIYRSLLADPKEARRQRIASTAPQRGRRP